MELDKIIEQRMKRTILMVKSITKKIVQKEFKKLRRDIVKGIIKK